MPHLALALPEITVTGDRLVLADKSISGLQQITSRWPGRVSVLGAATTGDTGNLGLRAYAIDELATLTGATFHPGDPAQMAHRLRPDVLQISLAVRDRPLQEMGIPHVVVAENPAWERMRYAMSGAPRRHRPKIAAGAWRLERAQRAMVRSGDALACNGWAAWTAYGHVARQTNRHAPLLFLDSRVSLRDVAESRAQRAKPRPEGPPRLAFSGRLHPAKGPQHAVEVSERLWAQGIEHSLLVLGDGPLRAPLETRSGPQIEFAGALPFVPDWTERVRDQIDLMLLPHTQGDPSGTYVETAAMGVPIAGFSNAALRGHVDHGGIGWVAPVADVSRLATIVARALHDPALLARTSRHALDYAERFAMEVEFDARVGQLLAVAERARA